jgi:hypothetical protein
MEDQVISLKAKISELFAFQMNYTTIFHTWLNDALDILSKVEIDSDDIETAEEYIFEAEQIRDNCLDSN